MLRRALPLFVLLFLAACAAHEKAGDRAAAVGDWKTAEREYAEAARKDPGKKELQDKYQQARAAALTDATRKAQACQVGRDWECAFAEADYALRLDPGATAMAALRRDAGREVGFLRLRRAEESLARRDLPGALAFIQRAREVTDDPAVVAESRRVSPGIVRAAVTEADGLRSAAQYPQAIELLAAAAQVDPGVIPRLDAVRAEYERWKDAEAERLAAEGDALAAQRRFAEAKASYDAALKLRPNGRAASLSRYAGLMATGDAAIARRDFAAAEGAFGDAARMQVDRGLALAELDRVKVRPYAIELRSVLVRPTRPDGYPWAGGRTRDLDRVIARVARFAGNEGGAVNLALDLARRVPRENQPNLVVTVGLPDGRGLQTAPHRGVYALLEGRFVVASNAYDDRVIPFRVVHQDGPGRPMDVGVVNVRLAELVASGEVALGDASVTELRVEAVPADLPDGAFASLTPIPDDNLAPAWSNPSPTSQGYRIVSVDATAAAGDFADEGVAEGAPDLFVDVVQRGTVVFRTNVSENRPSASFRPAAAYLFVEPQELLTVRLWDKDPDGADPVITQTVPGSALARGAVDLTTPRGSAVRLRLEPRQGGPSVKVAGR